MDQLLIKPILDTDAWYSGGTLVDRTAMLGLYCTMPVYFGQFFPSDSWKTSHDALITSELMTFSDTTMSGSELGYLSMTNGPTTGTNDKGDLINWLGNNETSVITLPALYASGGPFGFAFRAALTPVSRS